MSYSTEGVTQVRVRPLALGMADGRPLVSTGAVEVQWESSQEGRWHQVYVDGRLAGVTALPQDRRLVFAVPVGRKGASNLVLAEVVAVDGADRWTDFGVEIEGFSGLGARARLSWQAGEYLDPNLESFEIFGDDRSGTVQYEAALNESPIPAWPGGLAPWGFGCGGFGLGGYGRSAATFEWTTEVLGSGCWRFAVVAVDGAGNRLATAAEVEAHIATVPRPTTGLRVAAYDPQTQAVTLEWQPSPDV